MKRIIFLFITIHLAMNGFADEWQSPQIQEIYSQNRLYCLVVHPTQEVKPQKRNAKLKANTDSIIPCYAELYKLGKSYTDRKLLWKKELKNEVAPYEAVVTNDGKFVVTFDDWYSLGYGDNVMVVYNDQGELIKNYSLEKISPFELDRLETSVTSIWWFQGVETYSINPERITILIKDYDYNIGKRIFNLEEVRFEE